MIDHPVTFAVRDAAQIEPAEQYEESESCYLFVQAALGMFVNTIYPGKMMDYHRHRDLHQLIYVLEGRGVGDVAGRSLDLRPGISARIPADTPHRWRCVGDAPLVYLELKVPAKSGVNIQQFVEAAMPGVDRRRLGIDLP
jgi:mannose-6-phosphate isomerase-like protein (cupin superfamily)